MNSPRIYDAIIAGAGPVGLFLASELALANCSVLILERAESPSSFLKQLPFGIRGLSAPTIELLDRRGLLQKLELHKRLKNPHQTRADMQGPRRQVGHFAGIPLHEGDIDTAQWTHRFPGSTATNLISDMQELESVLCSRAEASGVDIRRGVAVTGFHQSDDSVTVQSGDLVFQGKWLVGCDGARSVVRKAGGFEFAGTEPEFTGYSTQVDIADTTMLKPGRNMTATGMYLQSQPGFIVIQDFDGGRFHDSGQPITIGHLQEVLRRVSNTNVTITALHAASTWTDRARQATSYRNGRVLLAGDAAHIHSPLGGQGLNLGLGDAMNLGWKLAATINGKAPHDLLDSYQKERHPLGEQVLDWSRAQVAIMQPTPQARALNAIFRDIMSTRDGATYMAGRVWGIDTRYPLGGEHPLDGRSAPHVELQDGSSMASLMQPGRGLMVDFTGIASLQEFASRYESSMAYVSGRLKNSAGLSALLVRPDGFVAWASDYAPDLAPLQQAADRWFRCDDQKNHVLN